MSRALVVLFVLAVAAIVSRSAETLFFDGDVVVVGTLKKDTGAVYLSDAPSDGTTYGRKDAGWVAIAGITNGAIADAPSDGIGYVRRNGAWAQSSWSYLTGTPTTAAGAGLTDVSTDSELASHASAVSGVHGITSFSATLLDDTTAAAWRATLLLGTSATKNVGTGASDVAQGNHAHTGYETTGAAAAAVSAHEAAADPHSQYQTQTESDARFLRLIGGTLSGAVNVAPSGVGRVSLIPGNSSNPGYVGFYTADGTRRGFLGWGDGTSSILLTTENGWGLKLSAVPSVVGTTLWHAGNDGSGSGLDSDLLDGQSGSDYLSRGNHTGTQGALTIGGGLVDDTEFAALDGVTSGIQAQINSKSNAGHGHNASEIGAGTVSNTELGYLDGVTSPLQAQINALVSGTPTIGISDVTGLQTALDGKVHLSGASQIVTADTSFIGAFGVKAPAAPISPTWLPVFCVDPRFASADVYAVTFSAFKTSLGSFPPTSHSHNAFEIGSGTVDNAELGYLDGVTSGIQGQLNAKLPSSGGTISGGLTVNGDLHSSSQFLPVVQVTTTNASHVAIFTGNPTTGAERMHARSVSQLRVDIGAAASSHSHSIGDLPVASSGEVSSTKLVRADDARLGGGPLLVASFETDTSGNVTSSTPNITVTKNTSPIYYTVTHNLGTSGTVIMLSTKVPTFVPAVSASSYSAGSNSFLMVLEHPSSPVSARVYILIY